MPDDSESAARKRDARGFGRRLHLRRLAKRLTTTELAAKLHVNESSVRAWEKDRATPNQPHVFALAELLEVEPAWLLYGHVEPDEAIEA